MGCRPGARRIFSQTVTAQDAKTVISAAFKAMGVDGLNSIYFYGVAQNGNLGQNNNSNQPWPDRLTTLAEIKASLGRK